MGKISEIYYREIDPTILSIYEAGKFYYYYNLIGVSEQFDKAYEEYETSQIQLKNIILNEEIKLGNIKPSIRVNDSVLGISSIKDKVVILI